MADAAYDFWLFDLDGTLVDVDPAYTTDVFGRVGDRLGHEFSPAEAHRLWHGLGGPRNDQLRAWGVDPATFWEVFHDEEDPQARAAATYLYDDAAWVGDVDVPVGLVTHCQRYLTDPVLDAVGIREWFDAVVCCDDELGWKPDPAPVEATMAELGVAGGGDRVAADGGSAGVLVGDGPHDVGAAWNAGLDAVHVERHGHDRRGLCVVGDRRVTSLAEL